MSSDAPFTPPRKKRNVLWWLGGVFVLLILLFLFQLFGPNPPIVVSPQTTYITSPLAADGLPDYEQYLLDSDRKGVTPENNAAALLWKALWPGELDPSQYALIATELGLNQIPSKSEALIHVHSDENRNRVTKWLKKVRPSQPPGDDGLDESAAADVAMGEDWESVDVDPDAVIDLAISRPWTSEQFPPLAEWVTENEEPLALLREASRRTRCYFPSPSLLDNQRDGFISALLPGQQSVREAARALPARAMWHTGEGRPDEAWKDLHAAHRIAALMGQDGHLLVEQLIAMAMSGMACDGTVNMLHHARPTADQARQIQSDLAALPRFSGMADSVDHTERIFFLDWTTHFSRGEIDEDGNVIDAESPLANTLNSISIDWNLVLRQGNDYYDRFAAAARLPTRSQRMQAIAKIEADLVAMASEVQQPGTLAASVINPRARSETAASILLSLFLPALSSALEAQDRANTNLELVRLAAALAVFRAERGAYPEKLEALVPGILGKLPVDLYTGKPYLYRRDGDGYLLYTVGENGTDDGGSNHTYDIFEGRSLDEEDLTADEADKLRAKIPGGADDTAIRVPRPAFKVPDLPAQ